MGRWGRKGDSDWWEAFGGGVAVDLVMVLDCRSEGVLEEFCKDVLEMNGYISMPR